MQSSLYAQIIRTSWTKKSRGGALATPRNSVPLAFPLQTLLDAYLQVEHFSFGESHRFQTPQIKREKVELTDDLHYEHGSFNLEWDGQTAATEFKWSAWYGGAPEQKVFAPQIAHFTLNPDQWARIRWQGRFSERDMGSWWYEHTCINVGCFSPEVSLG